MELTFFYFLSSRISKEPKPRTHQTIHWFSALQSSSQTLNPTSPYQSHAWPSYLTRLYWVPTSIVPKSHSVPFELLSCHTPIHGASIRVYWCGLCFPSRNPITSRSLSLGQYCPRIGGFFFFHILYFIF